MSQLLSLINPNSESFESDLMTFHCAFLVGRVWEIVTKALCFRIFNPVLMSNILFCCPHKSPKCVPEVKLFCLTNLSLGFSFLLSKGKNPLQTLCSNIGIKGVVSPKRLSCLQTESSVITPDHLTIRNACILDVKDSNTEFLKDYLIFKVLVSTVTK